MALARSFAVSLLGLDATRILIEADISASLPAFILVGLPDASLSEAPARVRAACKNSGLDLPARKITVNLSPASVPKYGSSFDLGIAVAVLAAAGLINAVKAQRPLHIGELALDGSLRAIRGVIPMVASAKRAGFKQVIVPSGNRDEAALVDGIEIVAFDHLSQVAIFHGAEIEPRDGVASEVTLATSRKLEVACFSEVQGQELAVQAAVVAAVGGHHLSLIGAPGCGKTMIAQRIPTILPPLTEEEALNLAAMKSLATGERDSELQRQAPFVAPHHSASMVALVGGGSGVPKPGLISRASGGLLFLDEAPEFSVKTLDALRQPLESGEISLARANYSIRYPAKVQLALAANPCPCGMAATTGICQCTEVQKVRYLGRISGPLLDRIDIQLRLNPIKPSRWLKAAEAANTSRQLAERVLHARKLSGARLADTPWTKNAEVPGSYLRKHLRPESGASALIDRALSRGQLSMRGYDKCLRLAWSVADLEARVSPNRDDIDFALWLRGIGASQKAV